MLIIADDMTGALDSGVMLQTRHISTLVQIDSTADIRSVFDHCDVIVVNTETRHLTAREAYDRVYHVARQAVALGIPYLYKKTDSALRGNIGAELQALLQAAGADVLHFAPAFPQFNRVTVGGRQLIDGLPLDESPFAQDPLNPASSAYVPDILRAQSTLPVVLDEAAGEEAPYICLHNAQTVEELRRIAEGLLKRGGGGVFAGCAAFIGEMARYLPIAPSEESAVEMSQPLMVFCGSMHEQGRRQIEAAKRRGIAHYSVEARSAVESGFWRQECGSQMIADMRQNLADGEPFVFSVVGGSEPERYSGEQRDISGRLPPAMAEVIGKVLDGAEGGLPMIIGGDTLGAFLSHMGARYVRPAGELSPGVVLATYQADGKRKPFVAKAGSFGGDDLLIQIIQNLNLSIKGVV